MKKVLGVVIIMMVLMFAVSAFAYDISTEKILNAVYISADASLRVTVI